MLRELKSFQNLGPGFPLFRVVSEDSAVVHAGSLAIDDVSDASLVTGRLDGEFPPLTLHSNRKVILWYL